MSVNKVIILGNVGQDPIIRNIGDNGKVAQLRVATTERFKDRNGEMREDTEWHSINAFGKLADLAEKYIHKGTQIYLEGKLQTRKYTTKDGEDKFITAINADNIQLIGGKQDKSSAPSKNTNPYVKPEPQEEEDDLPF